MKTDKNPSLGEGEYAIGVLGWDKELQQMPQSLTRPPVYKIITDDEKAKKPF